MAHFALINDENIVENIIVINNEDINNLDFPDSEMVGQEFIKNTLLLKGKWIQTSYNNNFRGVYAQVGAFYNEEKDAFSGCPQADIASWIWDYDIKEWIPPVPEPIEGKWVWSEEDFTWVEENIEDNA